MDALFIGLLAIAISSFVAGRIWEKHDSNRSRDSRKKYVSYIDYKKMRNRR